MNEDWIGEEVLDINDSRFPDTLREHGARFKNPARHVIVIEEGAYILYAEDGELLDIVSNCF